MFFSGSFFPLATPSSNDDHISFFGASFSLPLLFGRLSPSSAPIFEFYSCVVTPTAESPTCCWRRPRGAVVKGAYEEIRTCFGTKACGQIRAVEKKPGGPEVQSAIEQTIMSNERSCYRWLGIFKHFCSVAQAHCQSGRRAVGARPKPSLAIDCISNALCGESCRDTFTPTFPSLHIKPHGSSVPLLILCPRL